MICQPTHRNTQQLTCPARESGGYQCEVMGDHEQHAIGEHTIMHALIGNGYSCATAERRLRPEAAPVTHAG